MGEPSAAKTRYPDAKENDNYHCIIAKLSLHSDPSASKNLINKWIETIIIHRSVSLLNDQGNFLALLYLSIKFLYLTNVFVQLHFMKQLYGADLLHHAWNFITHYIFRGNQSCAQEDIQETRFKRNKLSVRRSVRVRLSVGQITLVLSSILRYCNIAVFARHR